jgi:uncharacterized membrane protein
MQLWQLLGDLHPKLVHFPLVLLLAGLLFDLFGVIARSERCHWAGKILTAGGTVMLLVTFISGIYAEIWAGRALVPHYAIELHELAANVASWGFVILAAWRLMLDSRRRGMLALYSIAGLSWYALLALTAHLGGQLITEYGAFVTGARAAGSPSLHDLNTLATRQTDLNLKYSEMMHHIFGWLTLALSGSLLAAAVFPTRAAKLKWVGPTLLLLGGLFLFFFADLDLYRLTDWRQWRDREVQLHKTISIVLIVVGWLGLRATARGQAQPVATRRSPHSPALSPEYRGQGVSTSSSKWAGKQAQFVAVMALIGGGMLFTHVHTVAPYANVAAGVYVAHVVMGLAALAIGASALLGDAWPRWRGFFAVVFAGCMLCESILLLTYNEGLPWYIGYGRYNRWGPNRGTVAPFGDVRAEMTFDNDTQTLDVRVLDRHENKPVSVAAGSIDLVLSRGYEETAVPLAATGAAGHFSAKAPFLKDVPALSARLMLPVGRGGAMKTGYFDPWVTPAIAAVPPNELARFVCPMHEGMRSAEAGECALCKMPMIPIDRSPRISLHDAEYDMSITAKPMGTSPLKVNLELTPKRDGKVLTDLARVHEKLLHLIIVSEDLTFFDHVHPELRGDGAFAMPYTFPGEGNYVLFADITPKGKRGQVFREVVKVGESGVAKKAALKVTAAPAKPQAANPHVVVELMSIPRRLAAGVHAQLSFRVTRDGRPVTDLEPYLGAMGHCVIISEDGQTFLHCHPEQLFTPRSDARGGPDVAFHTRFERPGKYKVWGQFRRGEKILVADFVVDVGEPVLPTGLMRFFFDD